MNSYCPECYNQNPPGAVLCEECGCPLNVETKGEAEEKILKNRYKIISPLSEGGEGMIFLVYDITLNKTCVAKKIYKKNLDTMDEEERKRVTQPFEREARILANLRHPNLPCVTDYFIEDNCCYFIMDYIDGQDLEVILEEKGTGFSEKDVIQWGIQICRVIEYLHSQKPPIIHGDMKTANLMRRNSDGIIILIDFGTASFQTIGREEAVSLTVGYAPPEQYDGKQEIRSDIYSLGATMFELLTGCLPEEAFKFPHLKEILPHIKADTGDIIDKCLSYRPEDRFNNSTELKEALLENYKKHFSPARKRKTNELILKKTVYSKKAESGSEKIRVFIVDDNLDIRVIFTRMVKIFKGIEVLGTASNGKEALEKINSSEIKPHVILMDRDMPVMNGANATREIKKILPSVKIIMLTAHIDEEGFAECFSAGADGYILKGDTSWDELEKYIKSSIHGEKPVSPLASTLLLNYLTLQKLAALKGEEGKKEEEKIEEEKINIENIQSPSETETVKPASDIKVISFPKKKKEELPAEEIRHTRSDILKKQIEVERKRNEKLTELLIDLEHKDPVVRKKAVIEIAKFGDRRAIIALEEARRKEGPLNFVMKRTIDKAIQELKEKGTFEETDMLLLRDRNNEYSYVTKKFSQEDIKTFDQD